MIWTIYALRDLAAEIYLTPFQISRNDVAPAREFQNLCTKPDNIVSNHLSDFELHAIGTVNLENGELLTHQPRTVAAGIDFQPKND